MGMLNRSQRCLKLSSHLEQLLLVQVTFFMGVALQKGFFKSLKNSLFRYDPGEGYTLAYHPGGITLCCSFYASCHQHCLSLQQLQ